MTRAYLKRVLAMDPLADADKMVLLRQRFIGHGTESISAERAFVDPEKRERVRAKVLQKLDKIRRAFWNASIARLQDELRALPVKDFPDLNAATRRLNSVLDVRGSIDALRQDENFHVNLFNMIRRLMTLGPVQAGELKGTYLFELARADHLRDAQAMALAIRNRHPQVYQLESAWFDQIVKTKRRKKPTAGGSAATEDVDGRNYGCLFMIIAYVVIKVLMALARTMGS